MHKIKQITLLLTIMLFTSCTVSMTIVWAPKRQCIKRNNNTPLISGSDLQGNKASQETKSAFDLLLEGMFK